MILVNLWDKSIESNNMDYFRYLLTEPLFTGIATIFLILSVTSFFILIGLIKDVNKTKYPTPIKVKSKSEITSEYIAYIIAYILPFISSQVDKPLGFIPLFAIILTIGFLYIRINLLHINPILNILGYRLFKIEDFDHNEYHLLTRRQKIPIGFTVTANSLSDNIYLEVKTEEL
jgi:hypothetical protein